VISAVCFDVDFTLIYPGPTFRSSGYRRFGERHGLDLDESRFDAAVAGAAPILDAAQGDIYDAAIFHRYTASIIRAMGGLGPGVEPCAVEIYEEWASNHHFEMYEDVPDVLQAIAAQGLRIGLISNSHRCLASFQSHFELQGLVSAAVSSSQHGYLKPHPSIFLAALQLLGVPAGEALMVGDSVGQDIEGARRAGMRAVLVRRGAADEPFGGVVASDVPVINSLRELVPLLRQLPTPQLPTPKDVR
jgi:putative hydrolase of the HAD superfamily